MVELTRSFSAYDTLTVVPLTQPLPPVRLTGEAGGHGDGTRRSLALAGDDDVIPRTYRRGDDLRRVHWRSTARYGELMVRREEQPQRSKATVLLDTRYLAYEGAGPDSAFEWAVSAAASTLLHVLEQGFAARLLTDTGDAVPGVGSFAGGSSAGGPESAEAAGLMMDTLAVVGHSEGNGLGRAYDALRGAAASASRAATDCWSPSSAAWTTNRARWRPGCGSAARPPSPSCWTPRCGPERPRGWRKGCAGCATRAGRRWPYRPARPSPNCGGRPGTSRRPAEPRRHGMSGRTRVTLFGTLATLLTAWSLAPLVETSGWLVQAALLLAVQAAVARGPGGCRSPGR